MRDQITKLLDQIDRLDQQATKGPWQITETNDCEGLQIAHVKQLGKSLAIAEHRVVHIDEEDADATLIALSRTALPALARAVRAVLGVLDYYEVPGKQQDPTGYAAAELETLDRYILEAITEALGGDDV